MNDRKITLKRDLDPFDLPWRLDVPPTWGIASRVCDGYDPDLDGEAHVPGGPDCDHNLMGLYSETWWPTLAEGFRAMLDAIEDVATGLDDWRGDLCMELREFGADELADELAGPASDRQAHEWMLEHGHSPRAAALALIAEHADRAAIAHANGVAAILGIPAGIPARDLRYWSHCVAIVVELNRIGAPSVADRIAAATDLAAFGNLPADPTRAALLLLGLDLVRRQSIPPCERDALDPAGRVVTASAALLSDWLKDGAPAPWQTADPDADREHEYARGAVELTCDSLGVASADFEYDVIDLLRRVEYAPGTPSVPYGVLSLVIPAGHGVTA